MYNFENKEKKVSIAVSHMSFMDLFRELKKSTDERTAQTISKAFETFAEQIAEERDFKIAQSKEITLKEINVDDFTSKADTITLKSDISQFKAEIKQDLVELELRLEKTMGSSKWQVISSVAGMLFVGILVKHFGFF